MSNDHGSRGHARWAASSTASNWLCSGKLAITRGIAGKESVHAAMGTAVHQIAERCLRDGGDASRFLGTVELTKEHGIEITEELVNSAQTYVDYVRSRVAAGGILQIEQYFSLEALDPPFDAGGTGDAVLWFPKLFEIEVVDLKNGMGVVEVEENGQLRTYGLGCVLANPDKDIRRIKVTVVQPRAHHRDGRIRSESFGTGELIEWTSELMARMHRSKQAEDELDALGKIPTEAQIAAWAEKWLVAGNCYFCPVAGACPTQRSKALEKAKLFLDPKTSVPAISPDNMPGAMSPQKLADTLDVLGTIEEWIKAVRAYAHARAERGEAIPGYQLADKHGNRKWAIDDEPKLIADLMKVCGLTKEQVLTEPKVKSPAQIEKVIGEKNKSKIASMWINPKTGTNLVAVTKTERPAADPMVVSFLDKKE